MKSKGAPGPSIRQFLVVKHRPPDDNLAGTRVEQGHREHLPNPADNTLELGGGGGEDKKTGHDKKSIIKKVSPVLTQVNPCISSMRAGMTEKEGAVVVVQSPGLLFVNNEEQHKLGGDHDPGTDADDDLCVGLKDVVYDCTVRKKAATRLGEEFCVRLNCVCSMPHAAKFGETVESEPHGLKKKAPSLSDADRFCVSDVKMTYKFVRPGEDKGEAMGIFMEQSQKDTEESPHEEHSRMLYSAQEVQERRAL